MEMGSGGSSSTESSSLTGGLRFGKKIYFEDGGTGSSKSRIRVNGSGQTGKQARCQVEGCRMDLSNVKAYYSRHRVCNIHSKSPKVIVAGLTQRFCQQCSRFHQLAEFDLEKRSCRRRLAGHNERRRKPQPETLLTSRYTRIAPYLHGNANTAMIRPVLASSWLINMENHQLNVFSHGSTSFTSQEIMNTYNGIADSSCALSLLSNPHQQPLTIWRTSLAFNPSEVTMAQPPPVSSHQHCSNLPWEFKAGEKSSLHYTSAPVFGQTQSSEPASFQTSSGTTMEGYQIRRQYLELENTRAYDPSSQHVNWSL